MFFKKKVNATFTKKEQPRRVRGWFCLLRFRYFVRIITISPIFLSFYPSCCVYKKFLLSHDVTMDVSTRSMLCCGAIFPRHRKATRCLIRDVFFKQWRFVSNDFSFQGVIIPFFISQILQNFQLIAPLLLLLIVYLKRAQNNKIIVQGEPLASLWCFTTLL